MRAQTRSGKAPSMIAASKSMMALAEATAWAMPLAAPAIQSPRKESKPLPARAGIVERLDRLAGGDQTALEQHQRGTVDELDGLAGLAGHRHRAERRGVAGAPGVEAAVENQPAADEGADVEIDEVDEVGVVAEGELRPAGGGGVVLEIHRIGQDRGKPLADVPSRHAAISASGAPISSAQLHSSNGMARPTPAIRSAWSPSSASQAATTPTILATVSFDVGQG